MAKVKKVKGYECQTCYEIYKFAGEAHHCCPKDEPEFVEKWECTKCNEIYEDKEDAESCC